METGGRTGLDRWQHMKQEELGEHQQFEKPCELRQMTVDQLWLQPLSQVPEKLYNENI